MKQLPTLTVPIPRKDHLGCYTHEAGRTCVRPLFGTRIALLLQNTVVIPLAKAWHLTPKHEAFLASTLALSYVQSLSCARTTWQHDSPSRLRRHKTHK